ncbi:MAG: prepilin-type N-terminal cleavage/methylation domain-containing protein [Elusimicrobiota bacterium]
MPAPGHPAGGVMDMRRAQRGRVSTASGVGTPRWHAGPAGFTLIELLVVVLIVGILMTLGIPQYTKTIESSKADTAAAMVKMIGQANRMYKLDNPGYANGRLQDSCNSQSCSSSMGGCKLVACKYLASQKWDGLDYIYYAGDPGSSDPCNLGATRVTACAKRCKGGSPCTESLKYNTWGYSMDENGIMKNHYGDINAVPPAPPN